MKYYELRGTVVKAGTLYPIEGEFGWKEFFMKKRLGIGLDGPRVRILARFTGEHRIPKKGEWYLSGAEIVAYQARNDLLSPYHMAQLVIAEKVEYHVIIDVLDPETTMRRA